VIFFMVVLDNRGFGLEFGLVGEIDGLGIIATGSGGLRFLLQVLGISPYPVILVGHADGIGGILDCLPGFGSGFGSRIIRWLACASHGDRTG
jgi:hypothetical protein